MSRTDPPKSAPKDARESFFIGFLSPDRALARFLAGVGIGLVAMFAGLGWLLAATQDDPGDGAFRWDWGPQTVVGRLEARPYPILHVSQSERFPAGHTLMLSGPGKRGVQPRADALDGQIVRVMGIALTRGALDMIQVSGQPDGLLPAEAGATAPPLPERQDLGRWRVTGEICDGKCYTGAMRPGAGLAHKACANLCLLGGVPPVFVATDAIDGQSHLLLADADGGPVTAQVMELTALLVEAEGRVERRGGILVFRIDPARVGRAP